MGGSGSRLSKELLAEYQVRGAPFPSPRPGELAYGACLLPGGGGGGGPLTIIVVCLPGLDVPDQAGDPPVSAHLRLSFPGDGLPEGAAGLGFVRGAAAAPGAGVRPGRRLLHSVFGLASSSSSTPRTFVSRGTTSQAPGGAGRPLTPGTPASASRSWGPCPAGCSGSSPAEPGSLSSQQLHLLDALAVNAS